MFGRAKPVYIDSWGGRRKRRIPRWLLLLLLGIAIGVGGVLFVQERYLPPRLSAAETTQLRADYAHAESERQRLRNELDATTKQLGATSGESKSLAAQLAASRQTIDRLREGLAFAAEALPPDPRGGAVEVRAARFASAAGKLSYDVLLYRERAGTKPITAVLQFVVAGDTAKGTPGTVTTKPLPVTVGKHDSYGGDVPLPEGFRARQATVNVLDGPDGKLLGMRVLYVK
jgi:hypothetical protein